MEAKEKAIPFAFVDEIVKTHDFLKIWHNSISLAGLPAGLTETADNLEQIKDYDKRSREERAGRKIKKRNFQKRYRAGLSAFLKENDAAFAQFCANLNLKEKYNAIQEEERKRQEILPFVEFIEGNTKSIAKTVCELFEKRKRDIFEQVMERIRMEIVDGPEHYECIWGHRYHYFESKGKIDLSQSVEHFLETELTGKDDWSSRLPQTYGDYLQDYFLNLGWDTMCDGIGEAIEKEEGVKLTQEQVKALNFECNFDPIYDSTPTFQFFFWEGVWEFIGKPDIMLKDLLQGS